MRRLNNKGFSFIEMLAVMTLLGILMVLAIPVISRIIVESRKQAYLDSVIIQKNTVEQAITVDKYYVYDKNTVYYFNYNMFDEAKTKGKSPFGEWKDCYVVVTFDGKVNHFYWTGMDDNGWKIDLRKEVKKLTTAGIYHSNSTNFIPGNTVGARDNIVIYKNEDEEPNVQTPSNDVTYDEAIRCFDLESLPDGTYSIINYHKECGSDVGVPSSIDGNPVTVIGENAFRNKGLTSVVLYYGITELKIGAFQNNAIKDLKLSSTIKTIGPYAFYVNQIEDLDLPDGVETIGEWAFASNKIKSVSFPKTLKSLGGFAFQNNRLTEFELKSSPTIGGAAFSKNLIPEESALLYKFNATTGTTDYTNIIGYAGSSKNIVIPESVNGIAPTTISSNAFSSIGLTSVTIPASIVTIGGDAFAFNSLTSVTFAEGSHLKTISDGAFRSNDLTNISIPTSVTSIGKYAFGQNRLTGENEFIYARKSDGSIDYSTIVSYGGGRVAGTVTIPAVKNGVKLRLIKDSAFESCKLTSITLPDLSVANQLTIENNAFIRNNVAGEAGFIYKITGGSIDYSYLSSYAGPTGGSGGVITIPKTSHGVELKTIGAYFTWMGYSKIIIPDSVTSITNANFSKSNRNNTRLVTIVNKTGKAFDWYKITGSHHTKPEGITFTTGNVSHESGDIQITDK